MDLLNEIVKEIGSDYAKIASDKEDKEQFIDTGSYIFNGLVSGSILGGVSSNRITAIAGETSTGKTFFSLAVVKNFLDNNPNGYVLISILSLQSIGIYSKPVVLTREELDILKLLL